MQYVTPDMWKADGKTYQFNNLPVFYKEAGNGEVLLLLHGFPSASWDWWKIWPKLALKYRLLAPDLLGFGFSDKSQTTNYTINLQADLIFDLLRAKGIQSLHILCHDYSVSVVQEMLARNAERKEFNIKSVCFLNGGMFPESYKPRIIQKLLMSPIGPLVAILSSKRRLRKTFDEIFGPNTKPTEQELDDFWYLMTVNGGKKIVHKVIQYIKQREENKARWTEATQNAPMPMCLIDGPEDPISGWRLILIYKKLIPNAEVVELPGLGHYPQTEAPKLVLQHYFEFRASI